jgi:hypothetical protein
MPRRSPIWLDVQPDAFSLAACSERWWKLARRHMVSMESQLDLLLKRFRFFPIRNS